MSAATVFCGILQAWRGLLVAYRELSITYFSNFRGLATLKKFNSETRVCCTIFGMPVDILSTRMSLINPVSIYGTPKLSDYSARLYEMHTFLYMIGVVYYIVRICYYIMHVLHYMMRPCHYIMHVLHYMMRQCHYIMHALHYMMR